MTIYKPTLDQQLAVQWHTERGRTGFAETIENMQELFEDLKYLHGTPACEHHAVEAVNHALETIYKAAERNAEMEEV